MTMTKAQLATIPPELRDIAVVLWREMAKPGTQVGQIVDGMDLTNQEAAFAYGVRLGAFLIATDGGRLL